MRALPQVSSIFLCLWGSIVGAWAKPTVGTIESRQQSIPTSLPGNWTHIFCASDNVNARALRGAFKTDPAMTIELCLNFCDSAGYQYAGVEFGTECYCDIRVISGPAPSDADCNMPCGGDASETCGAADRLDLFWNTEPEPRTLDQLGNSNWRRVGVGCFRDDVSSRTLSTRMETYGNVTPESCANACRDSGFVYMGLEFADECWCGNGFDGSTAVSDNDCNMVCKYDHSTFCGASNRLSIFHHQLPKPGQYSNICIPPQFTEFNLQAQYKEPPISGPSTYVLNVVDVLVVGNSTWSVLSACQNCPTLWQYLTISGGGMFPTAPKMFPFPRPQISINIFDGESPLFATQETLPPDYGGYAGYCDGTNPFGTGAHVLIGNGHADGWELCANSTANGRLDVVLNPVANHPHYDRRTCGAVDLLIQHFFNPR